MASSEALAGADHSHPHSHQTLSSVGDKEGAKPNAASAATKASKAIAVSAELAAYVARKSS